MISLLYVDDEPALLELCRVFLEREGDITVVTVSSAGEALARMKSEQFDAIVSDYQMPDTDGIAFLRRVRTRYPDIPFILFTGRGREEVVIEAINCGADSYVQKGGDSRSQFKELSHLIRQVVRQRKAESELNLMKFSVDHASEGIVWIRSDGSIAYSNDAICTMLGYTREEFSSLGIMDLVRPGYPAASFASGWVKMSKRKCAVVEEIFRKKDGTLIPVELVLNYNEQGSESLVFVFVRDISERRRTEDELRLAFHRLIATEEELRHQFADLKKSDYAVREVRQRYQMLFEESGDWIWEINSEGRFTRSNARVEDLLGYEPGEIAKKTIFDLLPETPDRPLLSSAFAGNEAFHALRLHMVRSDGTRVTVELSAAPVFSRDGTPAGFHGVGCRISPPSPGTIQPGLSETVAGCRALIEAVGDAIFVADVQTDKLIDANQKALALVHRTLPEIQSMPEAALFPAGKGGQDGGGPRPSAREDVVVFEDELIDREGRRIPVIASTKTLWVGDRQIRIGICHDISDIRAIHETLYEKDGEIDRFFRTGPDLLCIIDPNGRFLRLNTAGETLLCCRPPSEENRSLFDLIHPDDRAAARILLQHLGTQKKAATVVNRVAYPDGSCRWLEWRALAGGRERIYAVARDITEKHRVEQALEEASRKLHLFNDANRHDIKNRLSVLSGYLTLFRGCPAEPYSSMYAERIGETVAAIVTQLEFLRVYQTLGTSAPAWQRTDRLYNRACTRFGDLPVAVHLDPGRWEIFADPLIERVFEVIVDNAVRHGTTLTGIWHSARETPSGLVIRIEDDGVGIAQDKKEKIFTKGAGKSVANSLYLAREILSITGITIRETGQAGKGACFELLVPKGSYRPGAPSCGKDGEPAPCFINTPCHNHT